MKTFLISGLIDDYRIKTSIFANSPNHAIKVFQKKEALVDYELKYDIEAGNVCMRLEQYRIHITVH